MTEDIYEVPILIDRFLRRISISVIEEIKNVDLPITPQDIRILMAIDDQTSISISNLVASTFRDKSQLTRKIQTFEKRNLVVRKTSKNDQRVSIISLTPTGQDLVKQMKQTLYTVLDNIFEPLSDEEKKSFAAVLRKVS